MQVDTSDAIDSASFLEKLKVYYARVFPVGLMVDWLTYGESIESKDGVYQTLQKREMSFTLEGDIYIRYLSFENAVAWREALQTKLPIKMDIGAVFSQAPSRRDKYGDKFVPVSKELVFDIDMTDYDDVRTCCQGASICESCWWFMTVAVQILDRALREDFGFEHLLWVYSGRRGIHCWVCDERARELSNDKRSAVAEYLQVVRGGEQQARKVVFGGTMHPSLRKAFRDVLEPMFRLVVIEKQGMLDDQERWKQVLSMVPDANLRQHIEEGWLRDSDGSQRWNRLVEESAKAKKPLLKEEIMFALMYPRLDINVSKQLNHLLKSPFCVHPKTGRICVPFNPESAEEFSPFEVPTVERVLKELDSIDSSPGADADLRKTCLKEAIDVFKNGFLKPLGKSIQRERRAKRSERDW